MGGSIFVHTWGAYFGLAVSWVTGPTKEQQEEADGNMKGSKNNDLFAMIGTLFLWMFWPSFNGALAPPEMKSQHRVVINTVFALCGSAFATFSASMALRGKICMEDILNATLAGGVAVGSSSDLVVGPYGSVIIGSIAGAVSTFGFAVLSEKLWHKFHLHDTCGVHNLHGIPGLIGGLTGSAAAALASDDIYGVNVGNIFPERANGRTSAQQAQYQVYALLLTLVISIGGGILVGKFLKTSNFSQMEDLYDDEE